jgi:hypothetical protein
MNARGYAPESASSSLSKSYILSVMFCRVFAILKIVILKYGEYYYSYNIYIKQKSKVIIPCFNAKKR